MPVTNAASSSNPGNLSVTSVAPSSAGTPNSVMTFGKFAFVSIQGVGQIFTYDVSKSSPSQVGSPYATPCLSPSGMVVAAIGGANVMAVPCYDTHSLLTLTLNANGSLSALGSVAGLPSPYPGIVLDGTDLFVPLHGGVSTSNGSIARVSLATPSSPVVSGTVALVSAPDGGFVNPGYMAQKDGYLLVLAGSENQPFETTSTLQVVAKSTMTRVGDPMLVHHSPQQIVVHDDVAFVTYFDTQELQSLDVSDPTNILPLQSLSFTEVVCTALSIAVKENFAFVGCYNQDKLLKVAIDDPSHMYLADTIPNVGNPQRMDVSPYNYLMVTDAERGGSLYQVDIGRF